MPRPARPWFRFYSESLDNPKLQRLDGDMFKLYVNLLAMANQGDPRGQLPRPSDISFRLRIEVQPLLDQLKELHRRHLLEGPWQAYRIHDWAEWQPDSDANLTPGRKVRNVERTPLERGKNAEPPRKERSKNVQRRVEREVEVETEKETEGDAHAPEYPFSSLYAMKHRDRTQTILDGSKHGRCVSLEREYGSELCMEIAEEKGWDKHPNYYVDALKERRDGKPRLQAVGRSTGRSKGSDAGDILAGWDRYAAGEE